MLKKDLLENIPDGYFLVELENIPDVFTNMFKFKVLHKCGHEYSTNYKNLISNKRRCAACLIKKPKKLMVNSSEWTEIFANLNKNNEYEMLEEYVNMQTKIKFKHKICDNEFAASPSSFKRGRRCPFCNRFNGTKLSTEEFKQKLLNKNPQFLVVSTYEGTDIPITLKCNKCNFIFSRRPQNLLSKKLACPECELKSTSFGELAVRKTLNNLNLNFKEQVSFKGFFPNSSRNPFKFDFQVFLNEEKFFLIEYDGEQHFKKANKFKQSLATRQKYDEIKNDYCIEKGIRLLRIPYTEYSNITNIIINYIETISSEAS